MTSLESSCVDRIVGGALLRGAALRERIADGAHIQSVARRIGEPGGESGQPDVAPRTMRLDAPLTPNGFRHSVAPCCAGYGARDSTWRHGDVVAVKWGAQVDVGPGLVRIRVVGKEEAGNVCEANSGQPTPDRGVAPTLTVVDGPSLSELPTT